MFPSILPLSMEIIVCLNERLRGLKLLTLVLLRRLFYWGISMLFDHSIRSVEALNYGRGGTSIIVCFSHV
jgi:hypothetical protein